MATTKISELPELTSPTAGLTDKFLLVTDSSSGIPLSKKMTFAKFDELLDTSSSTANLAFNHANAAFNSANAATLTDTTQNNSISSAFNHANAAFNSANAATLTDTTQNNSISSAFNHANAGFTSSNSYVTINDSINVTQNNSITAAFAAANAATLTDVTQNNSIVASFNHANAAFGVANTASGASTDVYARNHSNSAFAHANASFTSANSISGVDITQNNSITAAFIQANSGFDFANVAANLTLSFGATTILEVLSSGSSAYLFTQYGALNNPNISTFSATTLGFKLNVSGHPFHIRTGDNTADYNTGLVHVSSNGTLSYDSAAQGKIDGTLFWRIPHNAIGTYRYRCANHPGAMIGYINVANTASIYFAYNT